MVKKKKSSTRKKATGNTGKNNGTKNLKPWKPGQSGNPNGRPKKLPVTDYLRDELAKAQGKAARAIAKKLIQLAMAGDHKALEILLDRAEGKPTQRIESTGADGGPLMVTEVPTERGALEVFIAELLKK